MLKGLVTQVLAFIEAYLRLRQRGVVPSQETNTPEPPAADIFGTKIVLKQENNGLLMPTARCMLWAKFLKFETFQVKAITWDGFSVGGT